MSARDFARCNCRVSMDNVCCFLPPGLSTPTASHEMISSTRSDQLHLGAARDVARDDADVLFSIWRMFVSGDFFFEWVLTAAGCRNGRYSITMPATPCGTNSQLGCRYSESLGGGWQRVGCCIERRTNLLNFRPVPRRHDGQSRSVHACR